MTDHRNELERNEYRLLPADETAVADRIAETVRSWRDQMRVWKVSADMVPALERIGAHAIGCALYDLRASELEWIAARVRLALELPQVTP